MAAPIRNMQPHFTRPNPETARKHQADNNGADFNDAMAKGAGGAAGVVGALASAVVGGGGLAGAAGGPLSGLPGISSLLGGGSNGIGGAGTSQMEMLKLQEEMQVRSQAFQTLSNCSKAEHDAKMNSIRNVKP